MHIHKSYEIAKNCVSLKITDSDVRKVIFTKVFLYFDLFVKNVMNESHRVRLNVETYIQR